MTNKSFVVWKNSLTPLGFALLLLGLSASPARSQDDPFALEDESAQPPADQKRDEDQTRRKNWVEIGAGYVSDDSFKFGKYNGLAHDGGYGVLNFEFSRGAEYGAADARYLRISGSDLGLSTRSLRAQAGDQGRFNVWFGYREIQVNRSDSAQTPYTNAGSSELTLPADWVRGQNTATLSRLLPSLQGVDLRHERERIDAGFDARLREHWKFATEVRFEDRDGRKSIGAVIGNSGGNPRSVLLPEPIDYATDQLDSVLSYTSTRLQLAFGYHLSLFDNAQDTLAWQNPYAAITGWDASAGFPTGRGQLAQEPDNQFHLLSADGGFNLSSSTRISGRVAIGRMQQDEPFLPYTINPVLAARITQPLPRDALDGRIDTRLINLNIASQPDPDFHWSARFNFDDRDNRTPRDEYVYVGGDSQVQNTAATSSFRRFNEPYSYREEKLRFDAGWRLAGSTSLDANLEHRRIERTYSEREEATERMAGLGLRNDSLDWVQGGVRLGWNEREGSTYIGAEPFLSGYAPGYTGTVAGAFENPPALRKYHLADRRRQQANAWLVLTPHPAWSLGLNVDHLDDDYTASELGLTRSRINTYAVDLSFAPTALSAAYLFWNAEKLASDQSGRSIRGGTRVVDAVDPARSWFADHRDRIRSYGFGLSRSVLDGRLELRADQIWSRAYADILVTTGSALTRAALPENRSLLRSTELSADYRLRPRQYLRLRYGLEDFQSSDWALDGIEANQLANVILFGEDSPDYHIYVIGLGFVLEF